MITHLLDQIKKPFDIITNGYDFKSDFYSVKLVFTTPDTGDVTSLFSLSGDTLEFEYSNELMYDGINGIDDTGEEDDPDAEPYRLATDEEKKLFLEFMAHNKGFMRHVFRFYRQDRLPRAIYDFHPLFASLGGNSDSK